jgi:dolichol-phosphate mannosyltransferase
MAESEATTMAQPENTSTPGLSVVVPCYDEVESIETLYERVTAVCAAEFPGNYELVLVDDGSTDGTRDIIREMTEKDRAVVGVFLSRNHGHQLALTAGLNLCRGNQVLVLDADLQDPPELLPQMCRLMDEGADIVYGKRIQRKGETRFKTATAYLFYRLLDRLIDVEIPKDTGDFRLMSRAAVDALNAMPEHHRFIRGMVSWIGFRQVPLEYERDARLAGTTKYPLRKMISFALDAISGFSTTPLRISTYLGFFGSILGIIFLGYTVYHYVIGNTIQGWTTTVSFVLILGSAQLLVLGVIGEYLGRLYMQSKNRPLYIINEIVTQGATGRGVPSDGDPPIPTPMASHGMVIRKPS